MSLTLDIRRTVQSQARQFTLDIQVQTDARHIALYGPSGSGKSLTVQSVAGLLRPDRGRISIGGGDNFESRRVGGSKSASVAWPTCSRTTACFRT